MSAALPLGPPATLRFKTLAPRVAGVLLASLLLHGAVLLWAQRELDDAWSSLPPAATTINAQLFVPPAPIAIGDKPQPARRASPRAISQPAPAPPVAAPAESPAPPAEPPAVAAEPVGEAPPIARSEPVAVEPQATREGAAVDQAVVAFPKFGRMTYAMFGGRGLLRIEARTVTEWRVSADRYEASTETHLLTGEPLLAATSSGEVRAASGIAPLRYTEKNRRRAELAANFIWDKREVTFSSTSAAVALADGTQDRLSFQAQLALLAQAFPDRFQPGATVAMNVVGTRDVRLYDFAVVGWEAVRGDDAVIYDTLKLDRPMNPERPDVRIEVWLAPKFKWLPVRVRMNFANGDFGDMLIQEIKFDE
jgi:hypothetical protein